MKEHIQIKFPNGHKFLVPIRIVAHNRAKHYAPEYLDVKNFEGDDKLEATKYREYYEASLNPDIALDWIKNEMDWIYDIQPHAERVDYDEPNYDVMFNDAKFKTI
jgi:hypothetical protein